MTRHPWAGTLGTKLGTFLISVIALSMMGATDVTAGPGCGGCYACEAWCTGGPSGGADCVLGPPTSISVPINTLPFAGVDANLDLGCTGDVPYSVPGFNTLPVAIDPGFWNYPGEADGMLDEIPVTLTSAMYDTGGCVSCGDCGVCIEPPPPPPDQGTCPFLAPWDGRAYVVDNDILIGHPRSYWPEFETAKTMYEQALEPGKTRLEPEGTGYERGDLYRLQQPPVLKDGRYKFLILEREPEESFMDELKLLKVVHEPTTQVFAAADRSKLYAFDVSQIKQPASCSTDRGVRCEELIRQPETTADALLLQANETINITFDYVPLTAPKLLVRAKYNLAMARAVSQRKTSSLPPPLSRLLARLSDWLLPMLYACQDGSIRVLYQVLYQDAQGDWRRMADLHPRALSYSTEVLEIPEEAMQTFNRAQAIRLRLLWTQLHALSFVGLVDGPSQSVSLERLAPVRAYHHRLKGDQAESLRKKDADYLHTIQGDVVEVEFETGQPIPEGKAATFAVASEGFYTNLRTDLYPDVDLNYYKSFWHEPPDEALTERDAPASDARQP